MILHKNIIPTMSTIAIDIDPFFVDLFALPDQLVCNRYVQAASSRKIHGTISPGRRRGHTKRANNNTRYDSSSENNSDGFLHGENISMTDEEYHTDAAVVHNDDSDNIGCSPNIVSLPVRLSAAGQSIDSTYSDRNNSQGRFDVNGNQVDQSSSGKKKSKKLGKKKRSSAMKSSLKKLVGGNKKSGNKPSSHISFSSFDGEEVDSLISSPSTTPSSYGGDNEKSPLTPRGILIDGNLSLERLSGLQLKISRIRSNIHTLEGDLISTRNDLARAHHHLNLATSELAGLQRASIEAEMNVSNLIQQRGGGMQISTGEHQHQRLSPLHFFEADLSTRSRSSSSGDRLNYFTPTSSLVGDGDDSSGCFTPRSIGSASYQSLLSLEKDNNRLHTFPDDEPPAIIDKDVTPLKKNGRHRQRRRFKFDSSSVKVSTAIEPEQKESNSIDTPSTTTASTLTTHEEPVDGPPKVNRKQSFIRTHDLELLNGGDNSALVCLHTTGAANVVNALFEKGIALALDDSDIWIPESSTGKILSKREKLLASGETLVGPMGHWPNPAWGTDILIWTTKCIRGGHGSEYPIVKARGLIPTCARQMVELLLDSSRSKDYNKMSLGRIDEHVFVQSDDDDKLSSTCPKTGIHGELKIVRSQSQPPVIRKPVELRLLLHARRLPLLEGEEGSKYLTIGRSIWETQDGTAEVENTSATRCEMLLSVNLIRDVVVNPDGEQWCEITTITHGVSPGIPLSIGKRIGLAAAAKYCRDIRAVFEPV